MSKLIFMSPKGEFRWAFISGAGRKNELNGKTEYSIDVLVPADEAQEAITILDSFWNENKPKGAKTPKTTGYKIAENGGEVKFTFKTSTTFPSGDAKKVRVFNAKAQEIELPKDQRIGNGSRGRVMGMMSIYDAPGAKGVTLYLDSVQLTKFVPYAAEAGFDADEDEGGFEGFANGELPFTADEEV